MTISRQDAYIEKTDVWAKLAAPLPSGAISWRIDSQPKDRDGKHFARFVAYIEANTVRERLDSTCPGEWDLNLELLPSVDVIGQGGEVKRHEYSFKARLQILGVIREDVGSGKDYKQASTDAFKRAAVRFGIGNELYAYEQNWVEVDMKNPKFPKPVEDPQVAYERRYGKPKLVKDEPAAAAAPAAPENPAKPPASTLTDLELISCPKCGGRMWDNRLTKRNPKAPDYKCQNRSCDGVIWPPKEGAPAQAPASGSSSHPPYLDGSNDDFPQALEETDDDLPF